MLGDILTLIIAILLSPAFCDFYSRVGIILGNYLFIYIYLTILPPHLCIDALIMILTTNPNILSLFDHFSSSIDLLIYFLLSIFFSSPDSNCSLLPMSDLPLSMNYLSLSLRILSRDHFYPKNQTMNPYSLIFLPSIS